MNWVVMAVLLIGSIYQKLPLGSSVIRVITCIAVK